MRDRAYEEYYEIELMKDSYERLMNLNPRNPLLRFLGDYHDRIFKMTDELVKRYSTKLLGIRVGFGWGLRNWERYREDLENEIEKERTGQFSG